MNTLRSALFLLLVASRPLVAAEPPHENRIVFLGDSITQAGRYIEIIEAHLRVAEPDKVRTFIPLGLSSETVSGLSEPGHAGGKFPRPDLHERLDRVLEKTKPDLIIACYGMNDGIYHPLSEERSEAYKAGIRKLRDKVIASGARIIHITPPVFDPVPISDKVLPVGLSQYEKPYVGYNEVLDAYARWLVDMQTSDGWEVIDLHSAMNEALAEKRKLDASFTFAKDGVHPTTEGQTLIAQVILDAWGIQVASDGVPTHPNGKAILDAVHNKHAVLRLAWLSHVGHLRPGVAMGLPLDEAEKQAAAIDTKIQSLVTNKLRTREGKATSKAKPNIVYILADDLGYGDVQCLNPDRGKIKTPHLDKLAAQGMAFTDAHSGSAVCTPTRYGLLTGRYAWRTRLQRGVLDGGNDEPLIAADRLTVGSLLQQSGYHTACIGKWHLGFQSDVATGKGNKDFGRGGLPVGSKIVGGPTTRGFDSYFGCSNARTMSSLIENDRVIESIEPVDMLPRLVERTVAYIRDQASSAKAGKPFFLYLPLTSPHTPIVPIAQWKGKSGLNIYADFVMQTDAAVGAVLAALDETGLASNTLVIFTSDNGCSHVAKTNDLERLGHFASGLSRGYKSDIWEGGHRVPFLVRWPNHIQAGSTSSQTICHSDFIATCADLLEHPLPENAGEDSVSILNALLGRDSSPIHEAVVHHSIDGRFAIRQGEWKLCVCPGSGGWSEPNDKKANQSQLPPVQLYNLASDRAEKVNLEAKHPEIVAQLTSLLEQYIANGRATPGTRQSNDVPVTFAKPKSTVR